MFRDLLREQIETVRRGGSPIGVVFSPEENQLIDLEVWLSERGNGQAPPSRIVQRKPRDTILDDRHEVYQVPFGTARPRTSV